MSKDYYMVASSEEKYFIFMLAFLIPFCIGIDVVILRSLMSKPIKEKMKSNPYRKTSLKFGICCMILFVCLWSHVVFIGNNLFFENIDIRNPQISTINDAVIGSYYFASKAMLYYALTYYQQSLLFEYDNNHKMSKSMIAWMVMSAIFWFVIGAVFIVDDALESSSKEIGFLQRTNVYFSVYMGHDGAPLAALAFVIVIIFDFIYFAVLIALFVSSVRKMKNDSNINENVIQTITHNGVKALILIIFTCIILWSQSVTIALTLPIRWIFGVFDTASDAICVYFLFVESSLYWTFFGAFHNCLGKCVYGSGYRKMPMKDGYDPVNMDDRQEDAI